MNDPNVLRNKLDIVAENLKKRGITIDVEKMQALEQSRKAYQVKLQELQNQRNTLSKSIGQAKGKGEDTTSLMAQVDQIAKELAATQAAFDETHEQQMSEWAYLPNMIHESVPFGKDENDNVEVRKWSEPKKLNFTPKDHIELTQASKLIDFEAATKMSGARFVVMRGDIAKLHRALAQFMLQVHTQEHGYQETYIPYLVEKHALYGVGHLPKMAQDMFHIEGEHNLSLISTSEVSLTNLVRDSILDEAELPIRLTSHSPCFRSEAGSYGKDTKGMFRQHQFDKVELVQIVHPEKSYEALEELTKHAETILQRLELPYRVMALCSADIGFASAKTYDLEVWLPSQNKYREISSCSNTEAFQARRMQARFRKGGKPELVHTLNGSGLAVGRTLIAVLENYQDEQGNVHVPKELWPLMGGQQLVKLN
jgi:seryl-tRNA synthetase